MATPTYTLIDSTTLGSSTATITFSSLDTVAADYRDLVLIVEATVISGGEGLRIRFNGDTGSNYYNVGMRGTGSSTASSNVNTTYFDLQGMNMLTGANSLYVCQFLDFAQTDKHKTALFRGNRPSGVVFAGASRWASTSALTTITVQTTGNDFSAGGTFYLYGIAG